DVERGATAARVDGNGMIAFVEIHLGSPQSGQLLRFYDNGIVPTRFECGRAKHVVALVIHIHDIGIGGGRNAFSNAHQALNALHAFRGAADVPPVLGPAIDDLQGSNVGVDVGGGAAGAAVDLDRVVPGVEKALPIDGGVATEIGDR